MSNAPNFQQNKENRFRDCLSQLPLCATERILFYLDQAITYEPVIGIMAKSSAGKSSLFNALFQPPSALPVI